MVTSAERAEYLEELRREVCARCVEKPRGGPPCGPLGKVCGVELHLEELVDSVRQVKSNFIKPYLDHNRAQVCAKCAFLHTECCPCPMDTLAVLVAEAIETVDARRRANRACER